VSVEDDEAIERALDSEGANALQLGPIGKTRAAQAGRASELMQRRLNRIYEALGNFRPA